MRCLARGWLVASVWVLAQPSTADAQLIRTIGRLFVTADVGGRIADPSCDEGEPGLVPAPFARMATNLSVVAGQSDSPFVLDAGNLLSPHGVTRYAAQEQPEALADLIETLGYRALAVGSQDLAAPRPGLVATARALRERGVPMIASNLRCGPAAAAFCEVLVDGSDGLSIHRLGSRRAAVVSLLPPSILRAVPQDRLEGLELLDPAATLSRAVGLARDVGDDVLVIATIDYVGSDDPTADALRLVGGLDDEHLPDVLVVGGAGGELLFARPASFSPAIVSPALGGLLEVRIRENLSSDSFDILTLPLEAEDLAALPVLEWVDDLGPRFCGALGGPLSGGHLAADALDAEGLVRLAGDIARDVLGAEVIVLPRRLIEDSWSRDAEDTLTRSDLRVGLRDEAPLVRARVPAAWLTDLQGKAHPELLIRGAEGKGNGLRVNGRPLESRGVYTVVTTLFLSQGGLGALPGREVTWEETGQTLQDLAIAWLDRPRSEDPRRATRDPTSSVEWEIGATADATFDGTQVSNPGGLYEASQLTGVDTISFGGRLRLELDAIHPTWSWENDLGLSYTVNLFDDERTNPTDLVQLRTSFFYRGLRGPDASPLVPELFLENLFETEFTTPAADDRANRRDSDGEDLNLRDYYRLFSRPVLGVRFPLRPKVSVKAGFSVEIERIQRTVRRGDDDVRVFHLPSGDASLRPDFRPGFNGQFRLEPYVVLDDRGRILRTSFRFDANVSNIFTGSDETRGRSTQLRATTDFILQITGPFGLTLTYDLFYQRDALVGDFGLYLRGTIALTVFSLARGVVY